MEQKVLSIGNSVGIVIPSQIRKQLKINVGEKFILERVPDKEAILVRRKGSESATSITLEFYGWLEMINKKYSGVLKALAKR